MARFSWSKTKCTPGIYRLIGTRAVRVGESGCIETRAPKVARRKRRCLGLLLAIEVEVQRSRRARLRRERQRIINDWLTGTRSCNKVPW